MRHFAQRARATRRRAGRLARCAAGQATDRERRG